MAVSFIGEGTGENHRSAMSHWQSLSHNAVSSTPIHEQVGELTTLVVVDTDCIGSCKSNYHKITTTTAPDRYGNNRQNQTVTVHEPKKKNNPHKTKILYFFFFEWYVV